MLPSPYPHQSDTGSSKRGRGYVREGFDLLSRQFAEHEGLMRVTPPDAGAIAFVRYTLPLNSTQLCRRFLGEMDVLAVPGDHFGIDRHLRLIHGLPSSYVKKGLDRISKLLTALV